MKNIIYTLLITFMITACADVPEEHSSTETLEKTTSTKEKTTSTNYNFDISNAESLYISSLTGRTSSRDESKNKLFKVTKDGAVLEISFTLLDSDNNSYTVTKTKQPISIDNINTDYVVFSFGADEINVTECYLVHRSTGKIHLLGSSDSQNGSNCPVPQSNSTEKMILTDNNNNFYYRYYFGETVHLRKVNYTNPDNITATRHITELVQKFVVDSNGNVAYNSHSYIGLDGNITSNEYITTADYRFKLSNKLIFVLTGHWSNKIIIDNGSKTNTIDLPLSVTSIAKSSSNYVYISGIDKNNNDTVIVKFNPNDNSFSKYTIGNYNLYNFNVTDNTIIFSALRKNDGKNVLGKIDKDGTLTITYESNFENLKLEK